MKVRSIFMAAVCVLCVSRYTSAQTPQVNNGGFETWETSTSELNEPTDWNSFKTASGTWASFGGQQMNRSTVKRPGTTGNYSVVIWSTSTLGVIANGNLTCGQINMGSTTPSSSSNYNTTITTNSAFYETLGASPDSLIVWIRFKPVTGSNQGRVHAIIHGAYNVHDPIDATSATHVKAEATLNYASTGTTWVRKSIPFIYNATTNTPDYILISFSTNPTAGGGNAGDSLYVDDLSLFYNPVLTTSAISTTTYYVSSSQTASISVPFTLTGSMVAGNVVTAQLSDASGSFAAPVTIGTLAATTSNTIPCTIPAGTPTGSGYRVRVVTNTYPLTAADNGSNLQIYLASNSVTSAATQTIEAGTNGTALNVSETGVATSREWKYATSIGGPYNSFTVAQTGTTLTPNFAAYGNYFVECISTFPSSIVITSNPVEIDVVDNLITPATTQYVDMGASGTQIGVAEYPAAATSREWLYGTTSGGPYTSFVPAETLIDYTPLFNVAGTYYVICRSNFSGLDVNSGEATIIVTDVTGIDNNQSKFTAVYFSNNQLVVDMQQSSFNEPVMQVYDIAGQLISSFSLQNNKINTKELNIPCGVYMFRIVDGENTIGGKIVK